MSPRHLFVTLDTEVDKRRDWRISDPVAFRSVTEAVPGLLSPLFERYGVVPTYLLSPEVIADAACAATLAKLGHRAELGTHLHSELIEPEPSLTPQTMAGQRTDEVQCQHPPQLERAKLAALTDLFERTFGYRPTSFRAGRFGLGAATLPALAELGYLVDSSVTPGLRWDYPQATIDFRDWSDRPSWVQTGGGQILELPLSIQAGSRLAPLMAGRGKGNATRALIRAAGRRAQHQWLRPSWAGGRELVRFVERSERELFVLMLHSMEVVPGASPYAATSGDVARIISSMDTLFAHCRRAGFAFAGLSHAARLVPRTAQA